MPKPFDFDDFIMHFKTFVIAISNNAAQQMKDVDIKSKFIIIPIQPSFLDFKDENGNKFKHNKYPKTSLMGGVGNRNTMKELCLWILLSYFLVNRVLGSVQCENDSNGEIK